MIYLLLPVHNRHDITRQFIESLTSQQDQDYHLVLIDDGCKDGTVEMVQSKVSSLSIIHGKGDWWWGGSLHQGYLWLKRKKLAMDDILLFMNDDSVIPKDFLARGRQIIKENPNSMVLAQTYIDGSDKPYCIGAHIDWKQLHFEIAKAEKDINCFSTRGLFVRAHYFIKAGGCYPRLLPHYFSDYELTIRLNRQGVGFLSEPTLRLWADDTATGFHHIENNSNLLLFLKKFFSKKTPANPIYRSTFILLACPWAYKGQNLIRIWLIALKMVIKQLFFKGKILTPQ